jgi:glycine/D-amino acid oxidase-like deaminating enzyme
VLVVGAGLVGLACAWLLQRRGHRVVLVDPAIDGPPPEDAGSRAALGVLMAQVFRRSSGRGWRLRQRSHTLWQDWIAALTEEGRAPAQRRGLLLLAADEGERDAQRRLAAERRGQGIVLSCWSQVRLRQLRPLLPATAMGGLLSPGDGQLDPGQAMDALLASARASGLETISERVSSIERDGSGWRLRCAQGTALEAAWLVLAAGLGGSALLEGLGHAIPTEPVLGQAVELELAPEPAELVAGAGGWPGVVVWRGINLVPRPDLGGGRRCWLGATLEPGRQADADALADLLSWGGDAPAWLQQATVTRQWQGLRCRPSDRPAPVLEQPEPGLLVASGHYRNGVLLAPATAEWVAERIEGAPA